MKPDYESKIKQHFSEYLKTFDETTKLTNDLGKLISKRCSEKELLVACLDFAKLSVDTSRCILELLKQGYIAQSFVLLRCYLEQAHLLYYLWKNPSKFTEWIAGKDIRPKDIGDYFETKRMPSWKETYEEWSNVVHGNSTFVTQYNVIWTRTDFNNAKLVLLGSGLMNVSWIAHKFNNIFGSILKELNLDDLKTIIERYNKLENNIVSMYETQVRLENDKLNGGGNGKS